MDELSSCESPQYLSEDSTHTFILRNIEGSQRVIQDIEYDLSLNYSGQKLQKSNIAVFNHDQKYFTPTFIPNHSHPDLVQLDNDYKTQFQQKIKRSQGFQSQNMRKPKSQSNRYRQNPNSNFCLICQQNFDNYFQHIDHPIHNKKMNSSLGNRFIDEIVHFVREDVEKRRKEQRRTEEKSKHRRFESEMHLKSERGQQNRSEPLNFQQKSLTIKYKKI